MWGRIVRAGACTSCDWRVWESGAGYVWVPWHGRRGTVLVAGSEIAAARGARWTAGAARTPRHWMVRARGAHGGRGGGWRKWGEGRRGRGAEARAGSARAVRRTARSVRVGASGATPSEVWGIDWRRWSDSKGMGRVRTRRKFMFFVLFGGMPSTFHSGVDGRLFPMRECTPGQSRESAG